MRIAVRQPRVVDLDALVGEVEPGVLRDVARTSSSRPTRIAVPSPWLTNE